LLYFMNRKRKPMRRFPDWAHDVCQECLDEAEHIINQIGVEKVNPKSVVVHIRKGTTKGRYWGWFDKTWKMVVLGLCGRRGRFVTVAVDPERYGDPSAIFRPVLVHELVHHWRMSNGYAGDHDPMYDGVVWNWAHTRAVIGKHKTVDQL